MNKQTTLHHGPDPIALARENWVRHGWGDAANGMEVVTSIMRAQQLLLNQIESILRPHGLTFARFETLRLLAFARSGTLPMGKLCERLQVHPASATSAVKRLEGDRLVGRSHDPLDRRRVLVQITAPGRDLIDRMTLILNEKVFTTLPISRRALADISDILRQLRMGFEDF